jgi:hypothetical protein
MFNIIGHKGNAIKTTLKFYLAPVRKQTPINAGKNAGQ